MNEIEQQERENAFSVDLNRQEYVRFHMLLAKTQGPLRHRRGQTIGLAGMLVMSLALLAFEWIGVGTVDMVTVLLVGFVVAAGALFLFGFPAFMRYQAGKTYDQSLLGGYSYHGMLYVYEDRLEKVSGGITTTLRFDADTVYMELPDMMVLVSAASRAIVLPARCLTPADAELVRETVFLQVPPSHRRLQGTLLPDAARRMEPPADRGQAEEAETLLPLQVKYTQEEFLSMVLEKSRHTFLKMMPFYSILSVFSALLFGLSMGPAMGAVIFLLMMLFFALRIFLFSRMQAKRLPVDSMTISLVLTNKGLQIGDGQNNVTRVPWSAIHHAVEKPHCVEFINNQLFICVPKRCIADMDAMREIVNQHMKSGKGGS